MENNHAALCKEIRTLNDKLDDKIKDTHKRYDEKFDAISDRVNKHEKQVMHDRNNLTQTMIGLIEQVTGLKAQHGELDHNLDRISDEQKRLTETLNTYTLNTLTQLGTINEKITLNSQEHKNNGYLIKWMMAIVSSVLIAMIGIYLQNK